MYEADVLQALQPAKIICVAWKWLDEKDTTCKCLFDYSDYEPDQLDDKELITEVWKVLDEADLVIGHNADSFDIKRLNARFIYHGLSAPSPYTTVDTLKIAKKYFKFDNNSLDKLGDYLGEGRKEVTGGFGLWLKCMAGDKQAWSKMKKYNIQDVLLLERIYLRLRPFIINHPDTAEPGHNDAHCPTCSSTNLDKRGFSLTRTGKKQRYQCQECGSWSLGPYTKVYQNE